MVFTDVIIIVLAAVAVIVGLLFLLNRWSSKKQVQQDELIQQHKQKADIYIIDMKRDKAANVSLPKSVMAQMPRISKFVKLYFIKAKTGPQIVTLMCDKRIFGYLEVKKSYKIELAGMYIVSVKGMKTAAEEKAAKKARKAQMKTKDKENKKSTKIL